MASAEPPSRVTVTLDASVPLERLVLTRLHALTTRSRQSWLRSLLIQGFILECRMLQVVREPRPALDPVVTEARRPVPPSAPYRLAASPRFTGNPKPFAAEHKPRPEVIANSQNDVNPFAHLRRVIG